MSYPPILGMDAGVGQRGLKGLLDHSASYGHTLEKEDDRRKKLKSKLKKKKPQQEGQ